jgi:hypothetical protein
MFWKCFTIVAAGVWITGAGAQPQPVKAMS